MLGEKDAEWIVYRLKGGRVNAVPRSRWHGWVVNNSVMLEQLQTVVVAEGLTREQAMRFTALTKED